MEGRMTDEEVIKVIAKRMGWKQIEAKDHLDSMKIYVGWWTDGQQLLRKPPFDITSRDALAPVLAGLTDREWERLVSKIEWNHPTLMPTEDSPMLQRYKCIRHVLTLPPSQLAHAIAESISKE